MSSQRGQSSALKGLNLLPCNRYPNEAQKDPTIRQPPTKEQPFEQTFKEHSENRVSEEQRTDRGRDRISIIEGMLRAQPGNLVLVRDNGSESVIVFIRREIRRNGSQLRRRITVKSTTITDVYKRWSLEQPEFARAEKSSSQSPRLYPQT